MANKITPFVKRMRTQGGTFYTFSSAVEDIGLNINERNNIVKMSNFALLEIPDITAIKDFSYINQNKFNLFAISGAVENYDDGVIKDGKVLVAESFQNYALNLEANLLAQDTYNGSLQKTVSEKVFWKWMKETGAIRWNPDINSPGYFAEEVDSDTSIGYNSVVKYIGQISAGAVRTDNFGTYNETYVLIPTSHGQTKAYFKQNYDANYLPGTGIGHITNTGKILGREDYNQPHPDGLSMNAYYDVLDSSTSTVNGFNMFVDPSGGDDYSPGWWYTGQGQSFAGGNYYTTDVSTLIPEGNLNYNLKLDNGGDIIEFKRSNVDALELEFNMNKLRTIWDGVGDDALTYDKMAIDYAVDDKFDFNAILVYYSVYNQAQDKILSTNLLGVLFLDAAAGTQSGFPDMDIIIPSLRKFQSNTSGFGSSYSFRINIKSDNMFDDTQAIIYDKSTSSQDELESWTSIIAALGKSLNVLNQHTDTINYITQQYTGISSIQTQQNDSISDLQYQFNANDTVINGEVNTVPLFTGAADGTAPLIESSIYMRNHKIGMMTNDPKYDVDIIGTAKADEMVSIGYQYMGDPSVDGAWRFHVSMDASSDMIFEKRINDIWVEKNRMY